MKFLLALILLFTFASCGCSKRCVPETVTVEKQVTVREVIHDTIFHVAADSSSAQFKLVTDSAGKIRAQPIASTTGRALAPPSITIKGDVLSIDCESKAQALFAQWKDVYRDSVSKTVVRLAPQYIDKPPSFLAKLLMWCGGVFILVIIWFVYRLYKRYWPKSK